MPTKHTDFIIQGMFRDTSEHAFDSKFAYENQEGTRRMTRTRKRKLDRLN